MIAAEVGSESVGVEGMVGVHIEGWPWGRSLLNEGWVGVRARGVLSTGSDESACQNRCHYRSSSNCPDRRTKIVVEGIGDLDATMGRVGEFLVGQ